MPQSMTLWRDIPYLSLTSVINADTAVTIFIFRLVRSYAQQHTFKDKICSAF